MIPQDIVSAMAPQEARWIIRKKQADETVARMTDPELETEFDKCVKAGAVMHVRRDRRDSERALSLRDKRTILSGLLFMRMLEEDKKR